MFAPLTTKQLYIIRNKYIFIFILDDKKLANIWTIHFLYNQVCRLLRQEIQRDIISFVLRREYVFLREKEDLSYVYTD